MSLRLTLDRWDFVSKEKEDFLVLWADFHQRLLAGIIINHHSDSKYRWLMWCFSQELTSNLSLQVNLNFASSLSEFSWKGVLFQWLPKDSPALPTPWLPPLGSQTQALTIPSSQLGLWTMKEYGDKWILLKTTKPVWLVTQSWRTDTNALQTPSFPSRNSESS